MNAKTFCSLAVLITLLSTISYSQTTNSITSKSEQKSEYVISLGGGYVGFFSETKRPNGFNVHVDLLYPDSDYFAFNIGINYSQFPGYHYDDYVVYYNAFTNDSIHIRSYGDAATISHLQLTPGVSFGNIKINNKFNYYLTAGLTVGVNRSGQSSYYISSSHGSTQVQTGTYEPNYSFKLGGFVSGRISYKISDKLNIFIEPSALSEWSGGSDFANYHINGGVSVAF